MHRSNQHPPPGHLEIRRRLQPLQRITYHSERIPVRKRSKTPRRSATIASAHRQPQLSGAWHRMGGFFQVPSSGRPKPAYRSPKWKRERGVVLCLTADRHHHAPALPCLIPNTICARLPHDNDDLPLSKLLQFIFRPSIRPPLTAPGETRLDISPAALRLPPDPRPDDAFPMRFN